MFTLPEAPQKSCRDGGFFHAQKTAAAVLRDAKTRLRLMPDSPKISDIPLLNKVFYN
jgi:hypothetical protein